MDWQTFETVFGLTGFIISVATLLLINVNSRVAARKIYKLKESK
jgi:hypothetical protein